MKRILCGLFLLAALGAMAACTPSNSMRASEDYEVNTERPDLDAAGLEANNPWSMPDSPPDK